MNTSEQTSSDARWHALLKPWHFVPWLVVDRVGSIQAGFPRESSHLSWPGDFWPTHLLHLAKHELIAWVDRLPWASFQSKQLFIFPSQGVVGYVLDSQHLALFFLESKWDLLDAHGMSLMVEEDQAVNSTFVPDVQNSAQRIDTESGYVYLMPVDLTQLTPGFLSAQWKMILESTPAGAMIATTQGFLLHVNGSFEKVTGYTRDEVLGKKIKWEYSQEEEICEVEEAWSQVISGTPWQGDLQAIRKDGSIYPEKITIWPLPDDHGQIHHVLLFIEDLSQVVSWKKELEVKDQQLQEVADFIPTARLNEARYHSIIQASQTGAWEYDLKTGILWISKEYYTMLGKSPNNPSGDSYLGYEQWLSMMHPEDRYAAAMVFKSYLEGDRKEVYVNSFRMLHASGADVWVLSRGQEVKNKDGSSTSLILGVHINITELKKAEQIIKDRDMYHQALLELIPDMLLVVDKHGICLDFKPGQVDLFAPPESFLGKPLQDFIPGNITELHRSSAQKALQEKKMVTLHYSAILGGEEHHYRSTIVAFDQDKTVSSITEITENVNRIRQLEKLLAIEEKQNQQLHEFAHIVSHHFRSQVAGLHGILNLMALDDPLRYQMPEIQWIQRSSNQLLITIEHLSQVLNLKRNVEGKWHTFGLGHLISRLVPLFEKRVQAIGGHLQWAPPIVEIYVHSVPDFIQRILDELVANAIRFREESKLFFIQLTIEQDEKWVYLRVHDNGVGIDPSALSHIFSMYKSFGQGNESFQGLGLFIAHHQAEALGGELTVESKPGEGTNFCLRLPL